MANKQESIKDYFLMAKEIAKTEKELSIERWDRITIYRTGDKEGDSIFLYDYDLPRHIAEKYDWVIRWRTARLQCQYPRYQVSEFHSPYSKVMGENIGMQKDINTFVAAKAQLTKQQRIIDEYVDYQKANNLFFDEDTDEQLIKAKEKLLKKEENIRLAEKRLKEKVIQYKQQRIGKAQLGISPKSAQNQPQISPKSAPNQS